MGDEYDPIYDDSPECANCGGEGFTYGCSWDWQCDTYDVGEGTCLCARDCDWCQPRRKEEFASVALGEALAKARRKSAPTPSAGEGHA